MDGVYLEALKMTSVLNIKMMRIQGVKIPPSQVTMVLCVAGPISVGWEAGVMEDWPKAFGKPCSSLLEVQLRSNLTRRLI